MQYRREIDGLRTVAVIPVMLFHAGFSLFSGGFVGVDIFFVISGYLITSVLVENAKSNIFSIVDFYERRARRILPALFAVLAVSMPVASLLLFPADLKLFAQSVLAVAGFGSNIYFWRSSNYFDTSSELKPLLHTWSLSVEEQFYLAYPLLLVLALRWPAKWRALVWAVLAAGSLLMAQWASTHAQTANFFLLPTRAWELLLGGLCSFVLAEGALSAPAPASQVLSGTGLALIAGSILCLDKFTPFPSFYALLPVVGACLVVLFANPGTTVGRLLGSKAFVAVGLVSYGAYLWHQPLFAFARHASAEEPGAAEYVFLIAVSLLLAYASWQLIERPFRNRGAISRRTVFIGAGAGLVTVAAAGVVLLVLPGRTMTPDQRAIYAYVRYPFEANTRRGRCFLDSATQPPTAFARECGLDVKNPDAMIWGDSHAAALYQGLRDVFPQVVQITANSCPPILGSEFAGTKFCRSINDFALAKVRELKPRRVILEAYWYVQARHIDDLGRTLSAIREASPGSRVTVVGSVPVWDSSLPVLMLKQGSELRAGSSLPLKLMPELRKLDTQAKRLSNSAGAEFVSPLDRLCRADRCLAAVDDGQGVAPTAFDFAHLTKPGAILVARQIVLSERSSSAESTLRAASSRAPASP